VNLPIYITISILSNFFLATEPVKSNQCEQFHAIVYNLFPSDVINNYGKIYEKCPEKAVYIPCFVPLKEYNGVNISSLYGSRFHPLKKVIAHHGGVDIACSKQDVIATASGTVIEVGYNKGLGNYIIINHLNSYQTKYAHLSKINVIFGKKVTIGDTIGVAGSTGLSTGVHVHYEVYKNGERQNPIEYLLLFYKYYENICTKN
jgi:murein DD-endopeptidase MepM/ murein hydrolase activator NlpD